MRPPFIALGNAQFFRRHQHSVVLSGFLLHALGPEPRNAPRLVDLFGSRFTVEDGLPAFRDQLDAWLETDDGRSAVAKAERLADTLGHEHAAVALRGEALATSFRDAL